MAEITMHNRKLVLGSVELQKCRRIRYNLEVINEVRDDVEQLVIDSEFTGSAPFEWVGIIFKHGAKNQAEPEYQKINKRYGDLPITLELNAENLANSDKHALKNIYLIETLKILIHIGTKYELPINIFKQRMQQYD
jgi:hypothetical protein